MVVCAPELKHTGPTTAGVAAVEIVGNARPVPVNELVGELLPDVVLVTVTVALFAPLLAGVNVTLYVAVPPPPAMVVEDKPLTTNWGSLEITITPSADTGPEFVIVYNIVEAAVPTQKLP